MAGAAQGAHALATAAAAGVPPQVLRRSLQLMQQQQQQQQQHDEHPSYEQHFCDQVEPSTGAG